MKSTVRGRTVTRRSVTRSQTRLDRLGTQTLTKRQFPRPTGRGPIEASWTATIAAFAQKAAKEAKICVARAPGLDCGGNRQEVHARE